MAADGPVSFYLTLSSHLETEGVRLGAGRTEQQRTGSGSVCVTLEERRVKGGSLSPAPMSGEVENRDREEDPLTWAGEGSRVTGGRKELVRAWKKLLPQDHRLHWKMGPRSRNRGVRGEQGPQVTGRGKASTDRPETDPHRSTC